MKAKDLTELLESGEKTSDEICPGKRFVKDKFIPSRKNLEGINAIWLFIASHE